MKPNRMRELLAEGKTPIGHMLMEFATRGVAKLTQSAGVDFVLIDMEHSGFDFGQVADLLGWFKSTPVAPIVRVPSHDYHFIARVMDAGALGIMAPNVRTVKQAQSVINAMRYAPEGQRGLGLAAAHTNFVPPNPVEYMYEANRNNLFLCQIESKTALANLKEIAALPGVDVLWVGHLDLTQSMGIVAQYDHPDFVNALKKVAAAAKRHRKAAGIQPPTTARAKEWMALGYNVISLTSDAALYQMALKEAVEELRGSE